MDKFREVEPFQFGVTNELYYAPKHGILLFNHEPAGFDYAEARRLRDFLDRALGDREGMVCVPKKPTSKLLAAMCDCKTGADVLALDGEEAAELYAALIAAAQDESHE